MATGEEGVWTRPLILDPAAEAGADERLQELHEDPSIEFLDHTEGQRAECAGLDLARELLDEGTRWVYYPWRRTVVGVLGPRAFRRVRLDRNRNKITLVEQERFAGATVGVVGLSVGHVIAHTLALEGLCGGLRIADYDSIELSNLNRIPATVLDIGVNKAVVAARRIAELDPYIEIDVFTDGLQESNLERFFEGLDVVIEECDSLDMKLVVREAARRRRVPVIMETSDRGLLDVERFDLEPDRPVFHGLLGDIGARSLAGLSTREKVPYVLTILEPNALSARMAASMAEIDYTLATWPQLGGDVTLGAATVAAVLRRILRGDELASGRQRIDLDAFSASLVEPSPPPPDIARIQDVWTPDPPTDPRRAIAYAASLAPSGGNAQPWHLELDDRELRVALAPEHTSMMDVAYRGSYVAIGAALFNARVAAASERMLGPWHVAEDSRDGALVATLRLEDGGADAELADLYGAMLARCTNRDVAPPAALDGHQVEALRIAAHREGARLRWYSDPAELTGFAQLLGQSDRIRFLSPALHHEMMKELRWPPDDELDAGLDVRTLALDATDISKLRVARRADVMEQLASWDVGEALGETTRTRVGGASGLLVLTVAGRRPRDFVSGGMALERMWLVATRQGLGLQPVSPVFIYAPDDKDVEQLVDRRYYGETLDLQARFRALAGLDDVDTIVLVLRVTHAPVPVVRSQRRALDAVLSVGS
jgi:molybdopterin/thiamine biosynthesis adenylyltransferase/nitroreductase